MNTFMFYLAMYIEGTAMPTVVLMQAHETAASCNAVLERAPKDQRAKWACIEVNLTPQSILQRNKL